MSHIVWARRAAYRYPQNNLGLTPVSMAVEPGERLLIAGPSGCGKSTLARCLVGLIPHLYRGTLQGEVWLNGLCTTEAQLWQLTERAGLVFQNPASQMLAESVEEEIIFGLENLGLSRAAIGARLEATLDRFGLGSMRARPPQTLSGGEQQKLALAAIMARQPPVLVLDEPLSMLDGTAASELVDHVTDLCRAGTTAIICEHREEYLHRVPGLQTLRLDAPTVQEPAATEYRPSPPEKVAHQLQVDGLAVALGGRPVLHNLGFAVDAGQVVAVVGRNGVGKTTLLRALAGLQKHEGRVAVNGDPPNFGLVFQNADLQLFNATVRDEILYRLPNPDMQFYHWLLAMLGLGRYELTPPLLLSEGEKKRVALAAVLMRKPVHGLLLDEPSLGQDAAHKTTLIHTGRALAEAGYLVIMTTHDLPLAVQADRLMLLGPQGFVADGPPAQVLDDTDAWAQLGLSVPDWVRAPGRPITPSPNGSGL